MVRISKHWLALLPAAVLVAACGMSEHPKMAAPRPAIGAFGLDLSAADPAVKAGDDFFAHAGGRWLSSFQIPEDKTSYGPFVKIADDIEAQLRSLIEAAVAAPGAQGSASQRVGDYYASFMDEAAIEKAGLEPITADLSRIRAARDKKDIATLFGTPGMPSVFKIFATPDAKHPDKYSLEIGQSGLGLPNRDYYLKDDAKLKEVREQYLAYIEQMLTLGGVSDAAAKAKDILAFETSLAQVYWPIERLRDAEATYNPYTKQQLLAYAPGFDWQAYLQAKEIPTRENFVLGPTTAIRAAADLVHRISLDTLQSYLTFHTLNNQAAYLPKRFDDAQFAFNGKVVRGQPVQRDRWKRAIAEANKGVGELVGRMYVEKYFPPESKAKVQALVANLRVSLQERLEQSTWLGEDTRKRALEKLGTFVTKIGYPDEWKDYSGLDVRRDDLIGNIKRAQLWDWRRDIARLDQPVDRNEWYMTPQRVNAYYNPLNNEIVFPAAILQPPFFDPNADDAVNYGGIGAVIGHEIGHGFDDQGRKFAADGSLEDWWTEADATAFTMQASKLIEQYSSFEALPGLNVNGAITIGENIGDLGGLNMSLHAYKLSLNGKPAPVIDRLTGEQRFFLSWAQIWRAKYRDEALRVQVLSDPHSPSQFRVNGAVRNMDEWYQAFDIKATDKLYLPPDQRLKIW
jgi:predicted metalloendopeptidase